jgi:hypothetical protein
MGLCLGKPKPVRRIHIINQSEKSNVRVAASIDQKQAVFEKLIAEKKIPADMLSMFQMVR